MTPVMFSGIRGGKLVISSLCYLVQSLVPLFRFLV
nr:MAG TPA: hypothetical protein [Caudoviricetes sp.]